MKFKTGTNNFPPSFSVIGLLALVTGIELILVAPFPGNSILISPLIRDVCVREQAADAPGFDDLVTASTSFA